MAKYSLLRTRILVRQILIIFPFLWTKDDRSKMCLIKNNPGSGAKYGRNNFLPLTAAGMSRIIQAVVKQFEEEHGIRVRIETIPWAMG